MEKSETLDIRRRCKMKVWNKKAVRICCILLGIVALFFSLLFAKREAFEKNPSVDATKVSKVQIKAQKEITGFAKKIRKKKIDEKEQDTKKEKQEKQEQKNGKVKRIVEIKGNDSEEYFTTSIVDGEVVTVRKYGFTILQLNEKVKLLSTKVWVNDKQSDFRGMVYLSKEENLIRVCCTYKENGQVIEIEKNYTVYVDIKHIVICTNLENNMHTKEEQVSFEAYGYFQGELLKATVHLNHNILSEMGENQYEATLVKGRNCIRISVCRGKERVEKNYTIYWDTYEDEKKNEVINQEEDYDENAPTLTCTLEDGKTVNNEKLNFQVNAKDKHGKWLDQTHFEVTCNGKKATLIYANEDQISFRGYLVEGYNAVFVKVEDNDGHVAKKVYTIIYKKLENGVVGTATITVEATTIGCGYFIPKTNVTIKENTNLAQILCQLLEENGFIVEYNGKMESGFYLARISKKENFMSPDIPKDLEEHLKAVDEDFPGDYYEDSLGEFDFSYGSGWMYQVNGIYPNYGFSDCYLQNGDNVRVRFTLHYGADIGGAVAKGNGGNEGDSGNWEKEW